MARRRSRVRRPAEPVEVSITELEHDGRGVGRIQGNDNETNNGKVVFVDGALPGETVIAQPVHDRSKFSSAVTIEVLAAAPERIQPACEYFELCGGCSLQHMAHDAQISAKQKLLASQFEQLGFCQPETWLEPVTGPQWHYRRKARLGARFVPKKGGMLIGFREKRSSYLTGLQKCLVLDQRFSGALPKMHELVSSLSTPDRIPQIEVAAGDNEAVIVVRHLEPLNDNDLTLLRAFGKQTGLQVWLQPKGPDSIHCLYPAVPAPLNYRLEKFDLEMRFRATDFTQVNADINNSMIDLAIDMLELDQDDNVLDLFCGLGNFTLPIARKAGKVLGIEADEYLVAAARENADRNGIFNAEFRAGNLYEEVQPPAWHGFRFSKLLLDPPRSGAMEPIKELPDARSGPERIVYVSCNPATLARDANVLVNRKGYRMAQAGIMDMFPHTSHVESIALFLRP
ncbi:MAG: 23S rRNA (uracil(1939)-C(5))-methyltransferase RlmD [Gammaproteobacteria bacterium]|nr:23S rRNA (uracil(1939)-C(5))-methyltransferase RlmD [Gammaproteobacteria bacterium]